MGGFQQEGHLNTTLEAAIVPKLIAHDFFLPLMIIILFQFCISCNNATLKGHKHPKLVSGIRIVIILVSVFLTGCGAYNFITWFIQGMPLDYQIIEGILVFSRVNFGFFLGRLGPQVSCGFGVLVGICIWIQTKRPWLFLLLSAVLLGQAFGSLPGAESYYFFAENLWEIVFFIAIFVEERIVWKTVRTDLQDLILFADLLPRV